MGSSGFAAEAIWVLEEMNKTLNSTDCWDIIGYADDDISKKDKLYYDHKILGSPEDIAKDYAGQELWYFCAIGNNIHRSNVANRLDGYSWKAATLIHPSVIMARNIKIGEGTYIGAASVICPNAIIDKHVIINVRVAIGHDARMQSFSQACPGSQINGFCEVGYSAIIGSNASIIPGKKIGDGATVGGNAQVLRSVKPNKTVIGVPARNI